MVSRITLLFDSVTRITLTSRRWWHWLLGEIYGTIRNLWINISDTLFYLYCLLEKLETSKNSNCGQYTPPSPDRGDLSICLIYLNIHVRVVPPLSIHIISDNISNTLIQIAYVLWFAICMTFTIIAVSTRKSTDLDWIWRPCAGARRPRVHRCRRARWWPRRRRASRAGPADPGPPYPSRGPGLDRRGRLKSWSRRRTSAGAPLISAVACSLRRSLQWSYFSVWPRVNC